MRHGQPVADSPHPRLGHHHPQVAGYDDRLAPREPCGVLLRGTGVRRLQSGKGCGQHRGREFYGGPDQDERGRAEVLCGHEREGCGVPAAHLDGEPC